MLVFRRIWLAVFACVGALVAAGGACTPEIGDKCIVSTDCSVQGDRLCDTSQPGGYCTQLNCRGNDCFNEAACVLFGSAVAGCSYDDRAGQYGSRVARSFCMKTCESDADCRGGYLCADPRTYPWNAIILDGNQDRRGCLPVPREDLDGGRSVEPASLPEVCGPAPADAAAPIEASAPAIVEAGSITLPPLFDPADGG
ncbi:MAG: hypothetical protein KIT84_27845 [Labilithrix sp.]|nr:hypothetical protein [Labilithrix sp.]MCW5814873.1 hypothetical protein [Labilithrix sp.]